MSRDLKQATLQFLLTMKDEGYNTETAHQSLLCEVNNIIALTKDRKFRAKESAECGRCDKWIDIDDEKLYQVSIIKREPFRDQELKIMIEYVCKQCL